jgi:hypothetical protein
MTKTGLAIVQCQAMKSSTCSLALFLLASACATTLPPESTPLPQPRSQSLRRVQLVSAPMGPTLDPARIGKADLEHARALLSRARNELTMKQWVLLDRKLTEAEQAWERFDAVARADGRATDVPRGVEGVRAFGLVSKVGAGVEAASLGSFLSPLLVALATLWPAPLADGTLPPWVHAQNEFATKLRDVSTAAHQVMSEATKRNAPHPDTAQADRDESRLNAFVVRGGIATPEQLQAGVAEHRAVPGLTGFSVQSAPGKTIDELAAAGQFRNAQISVTTVRAMMKVGVPVVPSPGQGYHNTAKTPMPLSPVQADAISSAFQQRPNPARAR